MTATRPQPTDAPAWRRPLTTAGGCSALGVVVLALGPVLPVQVAVVGLGVALIGAAFMLAWAADAGEAVFSGGLVLAAVALATVLPEFIIEVQFAYAQAAELVTANLTGATRLLLTGAAALPLVVALLSHVGARAAPSLPLAEHRRLELGILLVSALFAIQFTIRGSLSVFDSVVLVGLYVVYARRVQGTPDEEAAVVGVAAGLVSLPQRRQRAAIVGLILGAGAVVLLVANPFAHALLATGASVGIDPYLLIQSVVPVATEAPEIVVVAVLVRNHRPAHGVALFLAASVSQWTLGVGALPLAYLAGGGGVAMPLAAREQVELSLTIAVTLFVVAALIPLVAERVDGVLVSVVFLAQIVYPTVLVRGVAAVVLLAIAVDLLLSRRRYLRPTIREVWRRPPSDPG